MAPPRSATEVVDARNIRHIDIDGVRTRYYEDGRGEPLLLIHGGHYGFSDTLDMWDRQLGPLASTFRVYALDRLGQGDTDNPTSDGDYTFDAAYAHLVSWIQAVGIERAHVVGHSRGALFAALLALDYPERVQSATLVDTRTLAPRDPRYPMNQPYKDAVRAATSQLPTRATARVEPEANSYSNEHVTDDFVDRLLAFYRLPKTEQAQRKLELLEESVFLPSIERNQAHALTRIDTAGFAQPTLVVWGVDDPTAQLGLGFELFSRICAHTPTASFHAINQAGHYSFREKPAEFNTLLGMFCGSHPFGAERR